MLTIQRTGGLVAARDSHRAPAHLQLVVGMAPSFANVIGPVDDGLRHRRLQGFTRRLCSCCWLLPLAQPGGCRRDACHACHHRWAKHGGRPAAQCLGHAAQRRPSKRLLVGELAAVDACWDVHIFAVPVLGPRARVLGQHDRPDPGHLHAVRHSACACSSRCSRTAWTRSRWCCAPRCWAAPSVFAAVPAGADTPMVMVRVRRAPGHHAGQRCNPW